MCASAVRVCVSIRDDWLSKRACVNNIHLALDKTIQCLPLNQTLEACESVAVGYITLRLKQKKSIKHDVKSN